MEIGDRILLAGAEILPYGLVVSDSVVRQPVPRLARTLRGLLAVFVVGEILIFVLPMLSFHRVMRGRKVALFRETDELTSRSARAAPDEPVNDGDLRRYQAIESMPVWPVDTRIRRRFGVSNALLLIPVFAQLLGAGDDTQRLLDTLQKTLSG